MTAKVFVGNLVFSTTDDELKTAFAPSANVLSANIITRGRRSLGYGFVEFADEAEAEKAVAAMNKKEIAGRAINVELARPRDPTKEEVREKKAPKARQPRAPKAEGAAAPAEGAVAADGSSPAATGGRRRGPRRAPAAAEGANGAAPAAAAAATTEGGAARGGRRQAAPRRAPAAPRRPAEVRPTSETTLFVANVPFSTDDEQLRSFFAEYKPKSAHVVRMRNGRSRGYGFVEFEDQAGQQAGLAVNNKEVPLPNGTNLKLSVKVAMTPPVITPAEEGSDAAAAAPAAEASAAPSN